MSRGMLDQYLNALIDANGSDLHLRVGGPPRIRVNGILQELAGASDLTEADTEAIAGEIVRPHLVEKFSRGEEVDFAYSLPDGKGRFRVNAYLQRDTVAMVFRTVVTQPQTIAQLNLPDMVRRFADEPRGLVIVAGPTGSGKTTTLAAMVDHINRTRTCHIVTIEDPIEVIHSDVRASISQRELGADTPSFASAMRAALRQDPDVILVGEMRDAQTVATALMAAETGHLVLSTLHTTDATETMTRIVEFFPPHEQRQVRLVLAGVLKGTVCQRLVPTKDGQQRVPATEVMVVNGRIQHWITDPSAREDVQQIVADGEYYGMHTFDQAIIDLYQKGLIDVRAALGHASNPHDLSVAFRRLGVDTGSGPAEMSWSEGDRAADEDALADLVEHLAATYEAEAPAEPGADATVLEMPKAEPKQRRRRSSK
ncbi:MAG TPA: PilT/PilU family type 4a pilus ATPase [Acidimicrobiales bacterium]|jgi:twitching motility protein PilT|nr:PilT/PilU family type 4a pilus ATPase [Acidimicrobiales bacterium]